MSSFLARIPSSSHTHTQIGRTKNIPDSQVRPLSRRSQQHVPTQHSHRITSEKLQRHRNRFCSDRQQDPLRVSPPSEAFS